jgi:hypothetical protein
MSICASSYVKAAIGGSLNTHLLSTRLRRARCGLSADRAHRLRFRPAAAPCGGRRRGGAAATGHKIRVDRPLAAHTGRPANRGGAVFLQQLVPSAGGVLPQGSGDRLLNAALVEAKRAGRHRWSWMDLHNIDDARQYARSDANLAVTFTIAPTGAEV